MRAFTSIVTFASHLGAVCLLVAGPHSFVAAQEEAEKLRCGLLAGVAGFSVYVDGDWRGFDVELCRLTAQVLVGDAEAVELIAVTSANRFEALRDGDIDVLMTATAQHPARLLDDTFAYPVVTHINGITLLLPAEGAIEARPESAGRYCATPRATQSSAVRLIEQQFGGAIEVLDYPSTAASLEAYEAGRCTAVIGDRYVLAMAHSELAEPLAHSLFETPLTLEPLGPVVLAENRSSVGDAVFWTFAALVDPSLGQSEVLEVRFPGFQDAVRRFPGFDELYSRHFGPIGLSPGPNAPWRQGGLLVTPGSD